MRPLPAQHSRRPRFSWWRLAFLVILLLVAGNLAMAFLYRGRVLPNTILGVYNISGTSLGAATALPGSTLLPAKITLTKGAATLAETPAVLGARVDTAASLHAAPAWRRWVPLISLVVHERIPLRVRLDSGVLAQTTPLLTRKFTQPATSRRIIVRNASFTAADAQEGYRFDAQSYPAALVSALQQAVTTLTVPTTVIPAPRDNSELSSILQAVAKLEAQASTHIRFVYGGQTIQPARADIVQWFTISGTTMRVSPAAVQTYLTKVEAQLHISLADQTDLATAAAFAVGSESDRTFALTVQGTQTVLRTYCTAVRGVDPAALNDLTGMLAMIYHDARGWNDNGQIAFKHVDHGCQYTVWLSAATQMGSFGAICDDYYNCQIGTSVVLNYDRWRTATAPWNKTHGSLEDYRTLMINHETGHRLGFRDNPTCPGAGQPAPVMMQQSIALKGCMFNVWPRPFEFTQLDRALDLPVTSTDASE